MKFDENFRELRKRAGYSQEALAEKLNVLQEVICKWEDGTSYPELDKLMMVCDLFHCTLNDMLKEDEKDKDSVNVEAYEKMENKRANVVTLGVTLILLDVAFFLYALTSLERNVLIIIFLIILVLAVLVFVYGDLQYEKKRRKYPIRPYQVYKEADIKHIYKIRNLSTVVGTCLIFAAIISQQIIASFYPNNIANGTFMLFMAMAMAVFVHMGMLYYKYKKTTRLLKENDKNNYFTQKIYSVVMASALLIYMAWSFVWNGWDKSWIVFPVGAMLCGIVSTIMRTEE